MLLLLILSNILIITTEFINLPLKTKIPNFKNLSPSKIINTIFSNHLYTILNIGTPNKEIEFYIHLGFHCTSLTSLEFHKKSKSFSEIKTKYISFYNTGIENGIIANETFRINDKITLNNFSFFYSNDSNSNKGILGFKSYENSILIRERNFIFQLKKMNIISSYYFFFNLFNENEGNLTIGVLPHECNSNLYHKDNFVEIYSYLYNFFFQFQIDNILYGKDIIEQNQKVELLYEENYIRGNNQLKIYLLNNFFNEYIKDNKCFIEEFQKELISIYCNKDIKIKEFKNIKFYHKQSNFSFELDYKDLFKEIEDKYYFLIYFGKNESLSYIFGKPILKKYTFVFNQDKNTIGFYKNQKLDSKNNSILIWFLFIISFLTVCLLLIYIIIYKPGRLRRKRLNEIDEDFDYITRN